MLCEADRLPSPSREVREGDNHYPRPADRCIDLPTPSFGVGVGVHPLRPNRESPRSNGRKNLYRERGRVRAPDECYDWEFGLPSLFAGCGARMADEIRHFSISLEMILRLLPHQS